MAFFFSGHRLDPDRRELTRGAETVAVQPQVFDLLLYLIRHRGRVVSKDDLIAHVWNGRIVSDSTLTSRINAARTAVGDDGDRQALIRTVARKGIRFVGEVEERDDDGGASPSSAPTAVPPAPARGAAAPRQDIRYCRAPDGVRLAYAISGEGPPLVKTANWMNHLAYDWESPVWAHMLHGLSRGRTLVRYDARGNGLSDWEVPEVSLETWVSDLETVVDTVGLERFPLLGISQGCGISIAYATRHPERVSHLILYGGGLKGAHNRSPQDSERRKALVTLARLEWGLDTPAFRQMFTLRFLPEGTREQIDFFNELQRRTTSPECAARYLEASANIDVSHLASKVKAPTLVLHARDEIVWPIGWAQEMAAAIPDARFVALNSRNHLLLEHEPAAAQFLEEVRLFLGA
ncbi:MAG: alpha/beta fold hydrolase [Alphaproteobacteria bacterium]